MALKRRVAHRMTPKRRAALRKAQLASARKRKGHGKSRARKYARRTALGVGVLGLAGGGYAGHQGYKAVKRDIASGTRYQIRTHSGGPWRQRVQSPRYFRPGIKLEGNLTQVPYGHKADYRSGSAGRKYVRSQSLSVKGHNRALIVTRFPVEHQVVFGTPASRVRTVGGPRGQKASQLPSRRQAIMGRRVDRAGKPFGKRNRIGRANPHEDVVAAYRQRKPVIGAVRSAKQATPKVHVGPTTTTRYKRGILRGERKVIKRYNR